MKYLKYFKESNEFTGFDMKYINLIQSFKRAGAFPKSTVYSNLNKLLLEYTSKVKYLPNGVWEVNSDISVEFFCRGLNFKKGNLLYFNNGLIKYSTDKGLCFYNAIQGLLDFNEKIKRYNGRNDSIHVYYAFYTHVKPITDHKIFNNIKLNYKDKIYGEAMYKIFCDMYGVENIDSASGMNDMGFGD